MPNNPLCEKSGHLWAIDQLLNSDVSTDGTPINAVLAKEEDIFPHLRCERCEHVHIVIDVEYDSYEAAAAALAAMVKKASDAKPKRQTRREERRAAEKAERERQRKAREAPMGSPVTGAIGGNR
jgi:hypothetical protein